jgi:hypothetical protein
MARISSSYASVVGRKQPSVAPSAASVAPSAASVAPSAASVELLNIGVDFGGVCVAYADKHENMNNNDEECINVPGCVETLQAIRELGHRVVLVSYCGAIRARKTRAFLEPLGLFDELYFVKERRYKAGVCKRLALDVLIDDRPDVLQTINPTQTMLFTYNKHMAEKNAAPAAYKDKDTGKFVTYVRYQPDFIAPNWESVLRQLPNVRSLGLVPNRDVKTELICH